MGLSEDIISAIRERYQAGATFAELGKESGVSLTYLRKLMLGERDPMKLSLVYFLRLFPSARIELAPARAQDDPAAAAATRSDYQDLRDKYQDLRDKYQDLREKYQDLREEVLGQRARPPFALDGSSVRAPYPALSTSSKSTE